jgi:phosphatidylglycerophosphate synthase
MAMASSSVFPLIRFLSRPVTGILVRLPVSANQVTAASLVFGLGAAWAAAQGRWESDFAAGVLLFVAYVLDNCDGDIARLKNQCSRFGMYFDSFVDWVVHTAFFVGLGFGVEASTDEAIWLWLGLAAGAGGTFNYALGFMFDAPDQAPEHSRRPATIGEWLLFAFRELTRADFCFIVLALAVFDVLWVLLPAGAIGAQVYWMTALFKRSREFHV